MGHNRRNIQRLRVQHHTHFSEEERVRQELVISTQGI